MYFGGPLGASIGSGIGSLAAGRSAEEALQNAALAGATTYAMGGKDFGKGFDFSTSGSPFASPSTTSAITGNPVTSVKVQAATANRLHVVASIQDVSKTRVTTSALAQI